MSRNDDQPEPIRPMNNRTALERVDKAMRLVCLKKRLLKHREQQRITKLKNAWKTEYDEWILATNQSEEIAKKISRDSKQTCTILDVTKRRSLLRSMKQKIIVPNR